MHDPRQLLERGDTATVRLARRNYKLDLENLRELVGQQRECAAEADRLRADVNRLSRQRDTSPESGARVHDLKARLRKIEATGKCAGDELTALLLSIPNLPSDAAPDGELAVEISRSSEPREPPFPARDHADLGQAAHILDLPRAGKLSGRTPVAILEQYQQKDGDVAIPAALRPYTGFERIAPDGTPE